MTTNPLLSDYYSALWCKLTTAYFLPHDVRSLQCFLCQLLTVCVENDFDFAEILVMDYVVACPNLSLGHQMALASLLHPTLDQDMDIIWDCNSATSISEILGLTERK